MDGDGFQREHRVEPAPAGSSELPAWAKWGIIGALVLITVVLVVLLFTIGGATWTPPW